MNFGSAIRGHAIMTDQTDGGYFNQKPYIAPQRKGARLFRKKPKVNTDLIMCSLMDPEQNDRISLIGKTRGVNHAVKVNYGTQILSLTTGAQHYPTVPRKLEDSDYRAEHAAYRQDQLLPLSRLPRPVTSMSTNADVSSYFSKPLSGSDIELSRVAHCIKGQLKNLVDPISANAAPTRYINDVAAHAQNANNEYQYIPRDKMASNTMPNNVRIVDVSMLDESNTPQLIRLKQKAILSNNAHKQLSIESHDARAEDKPAIRMIRKVPLHHVENTRGINVHETTHINHTLDKKLSAPSAAGKLVTLYEITDPNMVLLSKLKTGNMSAGKNKQVYDTIEQLRAMAALELRRKQVPDARAQQMNRTTTGVYTETDHSRADDTARIDKKVQGDYNLNNVYQTGLTGQLRADNSIQDHTMNLSLKKKNAYCDNIDTSRFASNRRDFEYHLKDIQGIDSIPFNKGPNFIFAQTLPA